MDYATMPAGPEMDRLVAERVMGWRAVLISAGERHVDGDVDFRPLVGGLYVYDSPTHIRGPWSPSTDIAAAWRVVERMSKLCGNFTMGDGFFHLAYAESADHSLRKKCKPTTGVPDDYDGDADLEPWSCHLHVGLMGEQPDGVYPAGWNNGSTFCCKGPTAPLAICRAALAAVLR